MAEWCCMCRSSWEIGDHLLIHCTAASALWNSVLRSFGVLQVLLDNIAALLFGWYNCFGKHNSKVWNLVPLCLMWNVWREHNMRTFDDEEHSKTKLTELFFGLLFYWARVWGITSELTRADFVVSLTVCLDEEIINCMEIDK